MVDGLIAKDKKNDLPSIEVRPAMYGHVGVASVLKPLDPIHSSTLSAPLQAGIDKYCNGGGLGPKEKKMVSSQRGLW